MSTSGTTAYSRTAAQIVTAAQESIGVYVITPTYSTSAATIGAGALGILGVSNPSSAQTTDATTNVGYLVLKWATYGLAASGSNYPSHWVDALQFRAAVSLAGKYGKAALIPTLKAMADDALREARWCTQRTDGLSTLNMLAKAWSCYGLQPWARGTAGPTSLVDGTGSYTVGPSKTVDINRPLDIPYLYLRDSAGNDRPLTRYAKEEYLNLSDKDVEGTPSSYYYEEGRTDGTIYLWPVPDANYVASSTGWQMYFDYLKTAEDYDATTNDVEFPNEWFDALRYNLAVRFAPQYEKPLPQEVLMLAQESLAMVKDTGHEDGTITFLAFR